MNFHAIKAHMIHMTFKFFFHFFVTAAAAAAVAVAWCDSQLTNDCFCFVILKCVCVRAHLVDTSRKIVPVKIKAKKRTH